MRRLSKFPSWLSLPEYVFHITFLTIVSRLVGFFIQMLAEIMNFRQLFVHVLHTHAFIS